MRRFVVSMITTVDGYHAGPGGDVTAMPFDDGFSRHNVELLRRAEVLLHGARFWDGGAYWAGVAADPDQPEVEREIGRINGTAQHLVVSDSLSIDPAWPDATRTRIVRRADAADEIRRLKAEDGGDVVAFGSATAWNPLLAAGLVDELRILVGPALLGDGTPLYRGGRVALQLLEARRLPDSQLVLLRYGRA